jgi:hypothetical protein
MPVPDRQARPDALKIFLQAHSYFQAQELIYERWKHDPRMLQSFAIPASTLGAFSCELFLKCLVCVETGSVPKGHNLRKLFDLLTRKTRERLAELWDGYAVDRAAQWDQIERKSGKVVARDLPSAISAGSRAFELIRYRYEKSDEDFQFYLDDLPHMLGFVALELKPEWNTVMPNQELQK